MIGERPKAAVTGAQPPAPYNGAMTKQAKRIGTVAFAGLALAAAGCGGADNTPSVATVAGAGGGGAPAAGGGAVGPSTSSGRGAGSGMRMRMMLGGANAIRYSQCMRKHGEPNFPDPDSSGGISIDSSSGIDPQSPTFQAAQKACQKLLPHGGTPSPQQEARARSQALAFSACMRSHGVPKFPDPQFSTGRTSLRITPGSGIDPSSPAFQAAQRACQKDMPGGGPGAPPKGP